MSLSCHAAVREILWSVLPVIPEEIVVTQTFPWAFIGGDGV